MKNQFRRMTAGILAMLMVISSPVSSLAEVKTASPSEATTEYSSPSNASYDEEAVVVDAGNISTNTEAERSDEAKMASPSEAEEIAFNQSQMVDGIVITVTADKGVFPKGAKLKVTKVINKKDLKEIDAAVEEVREEDKNVASSNTFDIQILDNAGKEIQPDNSKGTVNVKFSLAEKLNEVLDVAVYHVEEATPSQIEETETTETDEEGILLDGKLTDDVTEKVEENEEEKEKPAETPYKAEALETEITEKKKTTEVEVKTESFSVYVVEFTYGDLQYVLEGDTSVKLSEIQEKIGLPGKVTEAVSSSPELFTVEKDAEGDDWTVAAKKAFTSEERLKLEIEGNLYEIIVTDAVSRTQAEAVAWIQDRENEAWAENYDGAGPVKPQCVDLICYYLDWLGLSSLKGGNAYSYADKNVEAFDCTYQSSPTPGDIAVWYAKAGNGYAGDAGHVALVKAVIDGQIYYVDVNGETGCAGKGLLDPKHNPSKYLRPNFSSPTPPEEPEITHTIYLDPNGGTCDVESISIKDGYFYGTLPVPTRQYYKFIGWFTSTEYGSSPITINTIAHESRTIYAHWEIDFPISGSCGDGISYTLNINGNLVISGNGDMQSHPWTVDELKNYVRKVSLSEGITWICNQAFENCTNLSGINLPSTLEKVGYSAFGDCISLKEVQFTSTNDVNLNIGGYAFAGCTALDTVVFPDELDSLSIGMEVFRDTSLKSIVLPKAESISGSHAFMSSKVENVQMQEGLESISASLFNKASYLVSVNIPETVREIEYCAFENCVSLESLTIPYWIKDIGHDAFKNCSKLTITGTKGSFAQFYAENNGVNFVEDGKPAVGEIGDFSIVNQYDAHSIGHQGELRSDISFTGYVRISQSDYEIISEVDNINLDGLSYAVDTSPLEFFKQNHHDDVYAKIISYSDGIVRFEGTISLYGVDPGKHSLDIYYNYGGHVERTARGYTTDYSYASDIRICSTEINLSNYLTNKNGERFFVPQNAILGFMEDGRRYFECDKPEGFDTFGSLMLYFTRIIQMPYGRVSENISLTEENIISETNNRVKFAVDKDKTSSFLGDSHGKYIDYPEIQVYAMYSIDAKYRSQWEAVIVESMEAVPVYKLNVEKKSKTIPSGRFVKAECSKDAITVSYYLGVDEDLIADTIYYVNESGKNLGGRSSEYITDKIRTCTITPSSYGLSQNSRIKFVLYPTANHKYANNGEPVETCYLSFEDAVYEFDNNSTYSITYELNGGTNNSKNPTTYTETTEDIILKVAEKNGYTFGGWYSDAKFTKKVTSISRGSKGDKTFYAKWTPIVYTIKFNGNGSTSGSMSAQSRKYDDGVALTSNAFKKTGYTFTGWNTNKDGSGKAYANKDTSNIRSTAEPITLYAQWKKNTYTITYELNGGKNSSSNPATYTITSATITLVNPTRTGYTFAGWYSDSKLTKKATTTIEKGSTGNKTFYAKWTANTYKIAFNANGGTGTAPKTISATYGKSYTLTDNQLKKTGYTFKGWNTKADGSGTAYANKASVKNLSSKSGATVTLYAVWTATKYTITYNLNSGKNSTSNPSSYYVTTATITLANPTRTGYTFGGWYSDSKWTNQVKTIAKGSTGNKIFYAKWTAISYTVKFSGNGSTSGSMSAQTRKYDDKKALTANTFKKTGYTFTGWNTKADGKGTAFANKATSNIRSTAGTTTLYAQWKKNTYTITYELNGGKNSTSNPSSYYVTSATITLANPTRTGYTFGGWYSDSKWTKQVKTIAKGSTGNKTFYAKWSATKYKITYNLSGGKNNSKNPASYYVTTADIKLQNPTRTGYTFGGWYSDSNYKTKVTSIKKGSTGNKTLYAKWSATKYKITYNLNGGKNSSKNPAGYYITTADIKLQNPTKTGYTFGGWYSDSKYKTKVTSIKKGSTGNKTLYAKWTANAYKIAFNANGGTGTAPKTISATYGKAVTLTANPFKRTGYKFIGWNTAKDGKGTAYANKASVKNLSNKSGATVTLYAQWEKLNGWEKVGERYRYWKSGTLQKGKLLKNMSTPLSGSRKGTIYLDKDGYLQISIWWCFKENNADTWYFFCNDGLARCDSFARINGKIYHFDIEGRMEHDKWVYMDSGYDWGFEGYMYFKNVNDGSAICDASAKFKNGKTYYFDKNGVAYSDKAHKKKITEKPGSSVIAD